jgi:hypothetical protein
LCTVGVATGAASWLLIVFLRLEEFGYPFLHLLILMMLITKAVYTVVRKRPASLVCRRSCAFTAISASMCIGFIWQADSRFIINWLGLIILVAFGICLEADRLWLVEAAQEKANLCLGYTGHVRDARCSVPEDGEQIRRELRDKDQAVDLCVEVLIRTGLSTSHLRLAAERAGRLGNASNWYMASVVSLAGAIWVWLPAHAAWWGYACTWDNGATAYLCIVQGIVWSVLFVFVIGPDRKAFASKSLLSMLMCLAMWLVDECAFLVSSALVMGPFVLTLTLAGPANISRIPIVGPMVVRLFIGDWDACHPFVRPVELWHDNATPEVYGSTEDRGNDAIAEKTSENSSEKNSEKMSENISENRSEKSTDPLSPI